MNNNIDVEIILASNSKRRQELLKMINIDYKVISSDINEKLDFSLSPLENCMNISLNKALDVESKTNGDRIIISCDTIVVKDNIIYGKPRDKKDCIRMLKAFKNTSHEVISSLTVIKIVNNERIVYQDYDGAKVFVDDLSDFEMNNWIENGKPYDKAGGYAIQEEFGKYIKRVEGDYYSIVGLPLNKLYKILREII